MRIFNIYSKRKLQSEKKDSEVFQYDRIPEALRVQIVHIWDDVFRIRDSQETRGIFRAIDKILCREYGQFELPAKGNTPFERVANFMLAALNTNITLDVIETTFKLIDTHVRDNGYLFNNAYSADDAILELNTRFREHMVGYQFESQQIIRVDSQFVHSEVVKPALTLLSDKRFKGANDEFLSAHEHYCHKKYKECLTDCLKALESTIKIICSKRGWSFKSTDTAKALIDILFKKELMPNYLQSHFTGLRTAIESGVPTIRNKLGGHGQGSTPFNVSPSIASYCLHLTAANIVYLIEADIEKK